MSKLEINQNKISKCQHCDKLMYWSIRRDNVNSNLTDDDVRDIAERSLGSKMKEWCDHCNHFTLQIVVAFDLEENK